MAMVVESVGEASRGFCCERVKVIQSRDIGKAREF